MMRMDKKRDSVTVVNVWMAMGTWKGHFSGNSAFLDLQDFACVVYSTVITDSAVPRPKHMSHKTKKAYFSLYSDPQLSHTVRLKNVLKKRDQAFSWYMTWPDSILTIWWTVLEKFSKIMNLVQLNFNIKIINVIQFKVLKIKTNFS